LVEQIGIQIKLDEKLKENCTGTPLEIRKCDAEVEALILETLNLANPNMICADTGLCPFFVDEKNRTQPICPLFSKWPVIPLPPQPHPWPTERRALDSSPAPEEDSGPQTQTPRMAAAGARLAAMAGTYSHISGVSMIGQVSVAVATFLQHLVSGGALGEQDEVKLSELAEYDNCGTNITCHIEALGAHMPLQDGDGDRFSILKELRGSDWRGQDCDDSHNGVYPGRRSIPRADPCTTTTEGPYMGDHNCNGISGDNATGSYEEMLCAGSQQRGLIMIGDSATAHFHVPPQWITANGWNINGFVKVASNELDQPHCSWGTAHATPEECPYQAPLPGIDGILSLYSQMVDRNRCNRGDFQNIGVNGARITSSLQLVDVVARDPATDYPALVWLSMIGNDVCNGHPGFGSMTKPDEFYEKAVISLRALDKILPPGSHVVSLALFEGELLYDIMNAAQHPVGCTYNDLYDFMNCLEENPCWGWLNSNATARALTTDWSHTLNDQYTKISQQETFTNFKYIYYLPDWYGIFEDYFNLGVDLVTLIEPADGFHPAQGGNAILAKAFFNFLEEEHPDAIGPINPHNAEIDALFGKK